MARRSVRLSSRKSGELPASKPEDDDGDDFLFETSVDEFEYDEDYRSLVLPPMKTDCKLLLPTNIFNDY
jgi:hypothetical protein